MNGDLETVSWERLAEPQADQYDSYVVLELMRRKGWIRREYQETPSFFDGKIALRADRTDVFQDCVLADANHPNVARTEELVRKWPAAFTQLQLLLDTVGIFLHTKYPITDDGIASMSDGGGFGVIYATVNSAVGFAGSLVHEMAHHKLRSFGILFETAERLIRNPPEQRFRSPVRYDCLRPMSAVLHGQYAYTYSAAMCLEIVRPRLNPALDRRIAEEALAVKLPKLVFGLEVLRRHAELDEEGAAFMKGLYAWSDRLFDDGFTLLKEMEVPIRKFAHPLKV